MVEYHLRGIESAYSGREEYLVLGEETGADFYLKMAHEHIEKIKEIISIRSA
jgi:hypothetical protein